MDVVQSSTESSPSTAATTPELTVPNDDIWASDNEISNNETGAEQRNREALLSDLPILKRQHITDGYREGLGIGKAKVMQDGFDQGYPVGIRIGLRAGKVLGMLEGVVAAKCLPGDARIHVEKTLGQARQELLVANLMKGLDDEQLMASSNIPTNVEVTLQKWESTVLGSANDRSENEGLPCA